MAKTISRFLFPASEFKVEYELRSLLGTGWFRFWWAAQTTRSSTDLYIKTNDAEGRVFINDREYLPAQSNDGTPAQN